MTINFKIKNELLPIVACSLAVMVCSFYIDNQIIRAILGFPFVLLFPGYTLTAALFPKKGDLSSLLRLVLSFGLSITAVPMLCYALHFTSWGIRPYPVMTVIVLFIAAMAVLAWYRRSKLPVQDRLNLSFELVLSRSHFKAHKVGTGVLVGAVLLIFGTLCYAVNTPVPKEHFTEFFILGQEGMAADYPKNLNIGETAEVTVGVINNEHKRISYRMEVRMEDDMVQVSSITLRHGEKWKETVAFRAGIPGKNVKVEFRLFRAGNQDLKFYRKLHLWMDVNGYE